MAADNIIKVQVLLFVLLAAGTIGSHFFIERYEKSGPGMLTENWRMHADAASGGKAENYENGFFLHIPDKKMDQKTIVSINQDIQVFDLNTALMLSADMKCEKILPGEKTWNLARLLLVQHTGQKDQWDLPHIVASMSGTQDWNTHSQYFTIGPKTKTLRVSAQLNRCTGSFWLKNICLYPVTQTQGYTWVKKAVLFSWGLFAVFLIGSCRCYGKSTTLLRMMLVTAFILIIIGTTLPGDMKIQVTKRIENQVQTATEALNTNREILNILPARRIPPGMVSLMPKAGHFCFFLLLAMVLCLIFKQKSVVLPIAYILLLAGGTEMAQFYVEGRTPLLTDFAIDAAGGLSGLVLMQSFKMNG